MTLTATVARCSKLWRGTVLAFVLALLVNGWPPAAAGSFDLPDGGATAASQIPSDFYDKSRQHPWTLQARVQVTKLPLIASSDVPLAPPADHTVSAAPCWTSARIFCTDIGDRCAGLWPNWLPDKTGPPQV